MIILQFSGWKYDCSKSHFTLDYRPRHFKSIQEENNYRFSVWFKAFGHHCIILANTLSYVKLKKLCFLAFLHPVVESTEGHSVILKCTHRHFVLEEKRLTVHWRHNDIRNVLDVIHGKVSVKEQDSAYKNRAEVLPEELKKGRVFLKLTNLQLSDGGTYLCFVPALGIDHSIQLVVKGVL